MTDYLILVPVAYLLGSLPFGLIAGWVIRRIDVREFGSGMTGMTNVLRTVGLPAAVLVLLLDMGKGVVAVLLAKIISDSHAVEAAAGVAALVGHNWPVFIRFRGGRGTASGWGSLLMLSPLSGLAAGLGLMTAVVTRYVSLGSILGAIAGVVTLVVLSSTGHAPGAYIWFGAIAGTLIVVRHKENIQRLLRGEERKIGQAAEVIQRRSKGERRKGLRWPGSA